MGSSCVVCQRRRGAGKKNGRVRWATCSSSTRSAECGTRIGPNCVKREREWRRDGTVGIRAGICCFGDENTFVCKVCEGVFTLGDAWSFFFGSRQKIPPLGSTRVAILTPTSKRDVRHQCENPLRDRVSPVPRNILTPAPGVGRTPRSAGRAPPVTMARRPRLFDWESGSLERSQPTRGGGRGGPLPPMRGRIHQQHIKVRLVREADPKN